MVKHIVSAGVVCLFYLIILFFEVQSLSLSSTDSKVLTSTEHSAQAEWLKFLETERKGLVAIKWIGPNNENLKKEFYENDNQNASYAFLFTSKVWSYMLTNYGSFGSSPLLILEINEGATKDIVYFNSSMPPGSSVNLMGIRRRSSSFLAGPSYQKDSDELLNYLASFVEYASKGRYGSPSYELWKDKINPALVNTAWIHIFTYDVYINMEMTEEAQRYKNKFRNLNNEQEFWFTKWFLPIYDTYGGNQVLNKYFQLLVEFFPHNGIYYDHKRSLTDGEFIHFWSGAAKADLQELAGKPIFSKNRTLLEESIAKAKREFFNATMLYQDQPDYQAPSITALPTPETTLGTEAWDDHEENLMRFKRNPLDLVNVCTEDSAYEKSRSTHNELLNFISNAWNYMTQTYSNIGKHSYLNLVFHQWNKYKGADAHPISVKIPNPANNRSVLDLGYPRLNWFADETRNDTMDSILHNLAYFVEFYSKDHYGSPISGVWQETSSKNGTDTPWNDIFTYDVYINLNMTDHAERFKDKIINTFKNSVESDAKWFENWFLPIYNHYHGNKVLSKFFELLEDNSFPSSDGGNSTHPLNVGEFVHFWSGAAQKDLKPLAQKTITWKNKYDEQLKKAKKDFPSVPEYPGHEAGLQKQIQALYVVVAAGCTFFFITIIALTACIVFYKRRVKIIIVETDTETDTGLRSLTNAEVQEFFEGDPNSNETQALVQSQPFIMDFEIPREQMTLDPSRILGSGQFGSVVQGSVCLDESGQPLAVAMKIVKRDIDVLYFKAFLSEVKIMAYLGRHPNIVELYGTCTSNIQNREIFLALEFCPLGNLESFLKKNRDFFDDTTINMKRTDVEINPQSSNISTSETTVSDVISTLDLLKWSKDVANAMMYLAQKKVIHGDLAARNVLLTQNRVAKISDFGLSRQYLNYANYMKTSKLPVPWRWLAIEALKEMTFSTASDVWAFGVTIWEIFSLAEVPYGAWTYDLFFVDKLVTGNRLLKPTHANNDMYRLMLDCWEVKTTERPPFKDIHTKLEYFILEHQKPGRSKNSVQMLVRDFEMLGEAKI